MDWKYLMFSDKLTNFCYLSALNYNPTVKLSPYINLDSVRLEIRP